MNILDRADPPFLFAVVIGALAWASTHLVSRALDSPLIEVSVIAVSPEQDQLFLAECSSAVTSQNATSLGQDEFDQSQPRTARWRFVLVNLSRDVLFENVTFVVQPREGGSILGMALDALPPAPSGNIFSTCTDRYARFTELTFHPGWTYHLELKSAGTISPVLFLEDSDAAIRLNNKSMTTWMVANETLILLSIWFIALSLSVAYVILLAKKPSD